MQYAYDAAGNPLSISSANGSKTAVFAISPSAGPIGSQVTIYCDGFSTTPGNNTVTFAGGILATVSSSTLSTIVTTVPSGANSGSVQVTTPAGTGTGSFTVAN